MAEKALTDSMIPNDPIDLEAIQRRHEHDHGRPIVLIVSGSSEDMSRADIDQLYKDRGDLLAEVARLRIGPERPDTQAIRNPERTKRLAISFAQEWLRPANPEAADETLVRTLYTAMLAFYSAARSADEREALRVSRSGADLRASIPAGPTETDKGWFDRQAKRTAEDIKTLPDWLRHESRGSAVNEQRRADALVDGPDDTKAYPDVGGPDAPQGSAGVVTAPQGDGRLHGKTSEEPAAGSTPADSHSQSAAAVRSGARRQEPQSLWGEDFPQFCAETIAKADHARRLKLAEILRTEADAILADAESALRAASCAPHKESSR